jgi:hypothetical protein
MPIILESRVMIMPTQHSPNADRTPPSRKHTDLVAVRIHLCWKRFISANHGDQYTDVADNWAVALDPKPAKCLELLDSTSSRTSDVLKCPF